MLCVLEYLREVLEVLMFLLLPPDDFHSTIFRFIIRVSLPRCLLLVVVVVINKGSHSFTCHPHVYAQVE